jgi:N-acetyl-anhydromuramyl-L-alanine amidase AmpD
MNKSRATRLLIGQSKNSEENKKVVKKILIFFTFFPIDQSEAELQIVSRVSRHYVIRGRF